MKKINNLRKLALFSLNFSLKKQPISSQHPQKKLRLTHNTATESRGSTPLKVGNSETTIGALFEKWRLEFERREISEPESSIENILAHVLGTTQLSDVHKNKDLALLPDQAEKVAFLSSGRLKHVPIQYLLGEWSFRRLTLKMSPPVFIPRPETEQLIDIVSPEIARKESGKILDLCCGSGAIALSLLQEHDTIKATAVDQSGAACLLTKENAQKNGLNKRIRVIQSQLERWECEEKFDVVVSNPPYIFREDLESLQPEIKKYEDLEALDGGVQGLDVIKTVLEVSSRSLKKNGRLFLEVEPRHPGLLQDYLHRNERLQLSHLDTYPDFSGKSRFLQLIKK